jgi:D-alanyl-D-alanine carboxypeptidase
MTADSHYRVGSTTKSFTAVILLQLINEGKLGLQDKVSELLPDWQIPNSTSLLLEHLLRMRSGLFDFEDDPALVDNLAAHLRPWSLRDVISLAVSHPSSFVPGSRFSYCNTNHLSLGAHNREDDGKISIARTAFPYFFCTPFEG